MGDVGKRLIESAKQALEFAKRTADTSQYRVHIPETIDVKAIREGMAMSQSEFATHFGFSVRQIWDAKPCSLLRHLTRLNHRPLHKGMARK